jgi:diguanylate cyclase (GGDEF)-like protein
MRNSHQLTETILSYSDIKQLELVFEVAKDGYYYMYPDGTEKLFNHHFYSRFDIDPTDVNKNYDNWLNLIHHEDRQILSNAILLHKEDNQKLIVSHYRVRNKKNEYIWIESSERTILDENNNIKALFGCHSIHCDSKIATDSVSELAYKDPLTDLYNRNKTIQCLNNMKCHDEKGYLLYIDLENFKSINTLLGFEVGDEVIVCISKMIQSACPSTVTLSRNYGAEFMLVACESAIEDIYALSTSILNNIQAPIWLLDKYLTFDAKICIYPIVDSEFISNKIIQNSQMMISAMKENDKAQILYYDTDVEQQYIRKLHIDRLMRGGLTKHEFYVAYQPIYNLNSGTIEGFETLLRWENDVLGNVSPEEFIPIAEKNHVINDLGNFVLSNACKFIKEITNDNFAPYVSVNVSSVQLNQPRYVDHTLKIIDSWGIERTQLVIEVTESITLDGSINKLEVLRQLCQEGLKLAIDDFGTGYSSLNSIITLPLSYLKIDKSLIQSTNTSPESFAMIELLVNFSLRTNYKIIAEGIETHPIHDSLKNIGISCGQGYLYSRPLTKSKILDHLSSSTSNCNLFEILC